MCTLACVAHLVGHHLTNLKVTGSIPSWGTCLGCRFSPQSGHMPGLWVRSPFWVRVPGTPSPALYDPQSGHPSLVQAQMGGNQPMLPFLISASVSALLSL